MDGWEAWFGYKGMHLRPHVDASFLHPTTSISSTSTLPQPNHQPNKSPQSKWVAQTAPTTPATALRAAAPAA